MPPGLLPSVARDGEEIVDDGLAVRLETRVRDGLTLIQASDRVYAEALERRRQYGWIGVERCGTWVSYWTTEEMQCAGRSRDVGPSALFPLDVARRITCASSAFHREASEYPNLAYSAVRSGYLGQLDGEGRSNGL
ncbi:MAG: isoaspartyl peptidase/L-asparaginase [Marinilabiliales bacterium]|nr:isoaspartyl peptidase/L-asparaginase [Marinilabiliales bacterium]